MIESMPTIQQTGGFACKRMNVFHVRFKNGLGISTIFGAMTYSSNRDKDFPANGGREEPMEAEKAEIMLLGNVPEPAGERIREAIGGKNTDGENINGPYADVTIEEWMVVANILKNL